MVRVGPDVSDDPPDLLLGGNVDASFKRAARYGIGWILSDLERVRPCSERWTPPERGLEGDDRLPAGRS